MFAHCQFLKPLLCPQFLTSCTRDNARACMPACMFQLSSVQFRSSLFCSTRKSFSNANCKHKVIFL